MMTTLRIRRLGTLTVSALLVLAIGTGVSQGRSETGTFEFQHPVNETVDNTATCLGPGAIGTITGTETGSGRYTENGPPAFGFHVHGISRYDYRVNYDDGRYILATGIDRFGFNVPSGQSTAIDEHIVSSDSGTLYAPDGQRLGAVTAHATFQITYHDANGDLVPDPGEITAELERFRLSCGR